MSVRANNIVSTMNRDVKDDDDSDKKKTEGKEKKKKNAFVCQPYFSDFSYIFVPDKSACICVEKKSSCSLPCILYS